MNLSKIKNIIEKKYEKVNDASDRTIRHFNPEDIHMFRVEVKKLRAFLRLITDMPGAGPHLRLPKKIRQFYKIIGIIRTLQIEQKQIHAFLKVKDVMVPEMYLNSIAIKISTAMGLARGIEKEKKPFKKGERQLLKKLPQSIQLKKINEFARLEVNNLQILLRPVSPVDESLHSIRKLLKDLQYTWSYTKNETVSLLPALRFSGLEKILYLSRLLGDFQDVRTSLNLLQSDYAGQDFPETERKIMFAMKIQWELEKETIRKQILKLLNGGMLSVKSNPYLPQNMQLPVTQEE